MRVPTLTQYQRQLDTLTTQLNKISEINQKTVMNKRLINSSDDPILSLSIKATQNSIQRIQSYEHNTVSAKNRATQIEGSIQGSVDVVARLRELGSQAASDIYKDSDRTNMAKEARGLLTSLLSNANKQDADGKYIFSGTRSDIQPFGNVNGQYVYMGSLETVNVDISEYNSFRYTDSGQNPFGEMKMGNGIFMIGQGVTPNTGTAETSVGSITSQSEYVEDTYTISFVTNSAGNIAYQIDGATSGTVVPASPAVSPADAPDYKEGESITFNGINLSIKGQPALTDTFVIKPSVKQNIIETINQFANLLETPVGSNPVDVAAYHQRVIQLNASMQQAGEHLLHYLSEVGYESASVDNQVESNKAILDNETIVLGKLSDPSLPELIELGKQYELSLQLSHTSMAQMQQYFTELLKSGF